MNSTVFGLHSELLRLMHCQASFSTGVAFVCAPAPCAAYSHAAVHEPRGEFAFKIQVASRRIHHHDPVHSRHPTVASMATYRP